MRPPSLDLSSIHMIVQACLNGARRSDFHPHLPLNAEAMARDGASCVAAGAAELHIHPRGLHGQESLATVDATIPAVRRACPNTLVGVSTGAWIENDAEQTRNAITGWNALPDYASVNLSEPDAPAVMELLRQRGVGIEAGVASVADAERFLNFPDHDRVFRILIEIGEQDIGAARKIADDIAALLDRASVRRPILLHGLMRRSGRLSALHVNGNGRPGLAWRMASISPMARSHPAMQRWWPPRSRFSQTVADACAEPVR